VQRNHNLMATPTPMATPGFNLGDTPTREVYGVMTPGRREGWM
jgi:singapore isolate B (sub-type 7) whole genome shotgun sequence assembly, scaffold_13